ncbi:MULTISPECIES: hypothetical protein [unclassified Bradyrhizobium]|uniref:hypothetical protein n=1 Tax=unclassified Bradyrhizobium TaxID=2631580 RepID=UPI0028E89112|nr:MULTISPECIES: hypothetical protein [unclassified Bradyrhizobium]
MAVDLTDGRRVFAPADSDPDGAGADRERRESIMMFVPTGVEVHLTLSYTGMRKGMDGLAMLVQAPLKKGSFLRPSACLRQEGIAPEVPVLGRQRALPVHQAH